MEIKDVSALNRWDVIRLEEFRLIVTGLSELRRCDLPAVWLRESIARGPSGFRLVVETDAGRLQLSGVDVRLIRNRDLAMLIPPIDA